MVSAAMSYRAYSSCAGSSAEVRLASALQFFVCKSVSSQPYSISAASGLAVAPGFVNMLSWANESLLIDGRSQGDIRQGVTLEVFGESRSDGLLSEAMQAEIDPRWAGEWTTLGEYLEFMVEKGVLPNVASFVGATTVRMHELGYEDRAPSDDELRRMRALGG